MNLEGIAKGAKIKGLNLVGASDFTFNHWLIELKNKLQQIEGTGLFKYNDIWFTLTTEVATYFVFEGQGKRVHHVIHSPSFEVVEQINERLSKYGNLQSDGRPILSMSAPELVEILMEVSNDILIYPAHAWTPWMSCLGSKSGFNSIEECYQDQTKHIYALETGLSSDPKMNWRLSSLDRFTLMSNSDSHSPWPWRLGRECNVFELKKLTYWEILDAVKKKDKKRFLFTIEVDPAYGKYHWTGHRNCNVSLSPKQSLKVNNICPVCHRKLTVGVEERVEELADREEGFVPKDAILFKDLIPLSELIKTVFRIDSLYSKSIWSEYNKLIGKFRNEFNVLLDAPREELEKITEKGLVDIIMENREGKIKVIPGYDGVYGRPVFNESEFKQHEEKRKNLKLHSQKRLIDF